MHLSIIWSSLNIILNDFSGIVVMDGSSFAERISCLNYYEKSFVYENTLERMSDCFSNKMLKQSFYFFILQCLKNIVRLGLEKLFMKVGYYDTE